MKSDKKEKEKERKASKKEKHGKRHATVEISGPVEQMGASANLGSRPVSNIGEGERGPGSVLLSSPSGNSQSHRSEKPERAEKEKGDKHHQHLTISQPLFVKHVGTGFEALQKAAANQPIPPAQVQATGPGPGSGPNAAASEESETGTKLASTSTTMASGSVEFAQPVGTAAAGATVGAVGGVGAGPGRGPDQVDKGATLVAHAKGAAAGGAGGAAATIPLPYYSDQEINQLFEEMLVCRSKLNLLASRRGAHQLFYACKCRGNLAASLSPHLLELNSW